MNADLRKRCQCDEVCHRAVPILLLLFSALLGTALYAQQSHHENKYARMDHLIRSEFARDNRGGLTVGIFEQGRLSWTAAYGFANEGARVRATAETIYPIASLTKMITGIMLLQLVERDKLHLADPVGRYVPEIKRIPNRFAWAPPVTLIQLATMTSGLESNPPDMSDMPAVVQTDTWDKQVLEALPYLKYDYEPGTRREYSNVGYSILGLALSRATGRPFTEYVQGEILDPLGMRDTVFSTSSEMKNRLACGYFLGVPNSPASIVHNSERDFLLPAGGLLSTLGDLAKLMRFQLGGGPEAVLALSTLDASFEGLVPSDGDLRYGDGIGFAAARNSDSQLSALGHGGLRRSGFVASYEFDRSTRTGVILLANTSYGRANYKPLVRRILWLLNPTSAGGAGLNPTEEH